MILIIMMAPEKMFYIIYSFHVLTYDDQHCDIDNGSFWALIQNMIKMLTEIGVSELVQKCISGYVVSGESCNLLFQI